MGTIAKVCDTVVDCIEYISNYIYMYQMTDSQKAAVYTMYQVCPSDNQVLKSSLKEVYDILTSSQLEFIESITSGTSMVAGRVVTATWLDLYWKSVKAKIVASCPYVMIFWAAIKTTTFAIIILMVVSYLKGNENTIINKRKVPQRLLKRAIVVMFVSAFIIIVSIVGLSITEDIKAEHTLPEAETSVRDVSLLDIFYEVFSAFGTVGLTLGITPKLSVAGKIIIIFVMFIGRLGPITISYAVLKKDKRNKGIKYPECDDLIVG